MSDLSEIAEAVRAIEEGRAPYLLKKTPLYHYDLFLHTRKEGSCATPLDLTDKRVPDQQPMPNLPLVERITLQYKTRRAEAQRGLAITGRWREGELTYTCDGELSLRGEEEDAIALLNDVIKEVENNSWPSSLDKAVKTLLEIAYHQLERPVAVRSHDKSIRKETQPL